MINVIGAVSVLVRLDRDVTYGKIEDALHQQGFLSGYLINRTTTPQGTEVSITLSVPVEWITAEGVPPMDAVQVLRCMADALEGLDKG